MSKTEAQTRKELIDGKLQKAGWNIEDYTQVSEEGFLKSQESDLPGSSYSKYEHGGLFHLKVVE
jgi:type I site-specific restriction endonuclease